MKHAGPGTRDVAQSADPGRLPFREEQLRQATGMRDTVTGVPLIQG